jgi:competence protein ComEA
MLRTLSRVLIALALLTPGVITKAVQDPPAESKGQAHAVVNLNTATAAQLETLPGIGARTAQRILDYRQKNGGFKKIEELMNVQGIGEKSFLKLKARLTVTPPKA